MFDLKDLYHLSQQELLSNYSGLVSHDLNNMINTLQTASQLLEMEKESLSPYGQKYLKIISQSTERLNSLSSRLHTGFSREDHLKEVMEIIPFMKELQKIAPFQLLSSQESNPITAYGSKSRLQSILLWLIHELNGPISINLSIIELNDDYCRNSGQDLKSGAFCKLMLSGEKPHWLKEEENIFIPWNDSFTFYSAKRSVMAMKGEIKGSLFLDDLLITIHLPSKAP